MYQSSIGIKVSIKKINVTKLTDKSVWIDGIKKDRQSKVNYYHYSLDDAKLHIKKVCTSRFLDAQKQLTQANKVIDTFKD